MRLSGLRGDHDVGAIPSSLEGDSLADASTRSGDENRLPGELPGYDGGNALCSSTASWLLM